MGKMMNDSVATVLIRVCTETAERVSEPSLAYLEEQGRDQAEQVLSEKKLFTLSRRQAEAAAIWDRQ